MPPDMPTAHEHQISIVEEKLRLAMLDSNADILDELISPELIFTNHFGQCFGKEDDIALHRSGVLKFLKISSGGRVGEVSCQKVINVIKICF